MCVSVHVFTQGERVFLFVQRVREKREDGCIFDRSSSSSFVFCSRRQSRVLSPSFILPLSSIEQRLGERSSLDSLSPSVSHIFHSFSLFPSVVCRKKMKRDV